MGVTISYRGRIADHTRVEDFEDRLLDLALEMGGQAQIWRSQADNHTERMIRGIILNLAPGQETTSLLLSPEGWLIGLTDIEDAELGRLPEPPWCFVKTQFGPIEGHVALVEMFTTLAQEFLTDFEVSDEGSYWETRNLPELARRFSLVQRAIDAMADGLERHGLSREAAEDPDILVKRIERVAAQVHAILARPAEHPPVTFSDDESFGNGPDPETTEKEWADLFKHNRRQQEWLQRSLEERRNRGENDEEAFDGALNDLGLEAPSDPSSDSDEPWQEDTQSLDFEAPFDSSEESDEEDVLFRSEERHPVLKKAMDLLTRLHKAFRGADPRHSASLSTLFQGAGDAMGGLAQALSMRGDDPDDYGLRIVQLKRALRGAAFARGALFPLRSAIPAGQWDELMKITSNLEKDVFQELARVRSKNGAEDS